MKQHVNDWRKSSYSGNGGVNCVEAATTSGGVAVRDTADQRGATLSVPGTAWRAFLTTLR